IYFKLELTATSMISIVVPRETEVPKDTARNIMEAKEFVVHIVDGNNVEEVNKPAISLPHEESELALTNLTLIPSTKIKVPGIKESKVRFEAVLENVFEIKDNDRSEEHT